jgi:hypothetical protein
MKLTKVRAPTHKTTERAWWVEGSDHLRPQKPREKPRAVASLAETSRHRLTSVCVWVCVCRLHFFTKKTAEKNITYLTTQSLARGKVTLRSVLTPRRNVQRSGAHSASHVREWQGEEELFSPSLQMAPKTTLLFNLVCNFFSSFGGPRGALLRGPLLEERGPGRASMRRYGWPHPLELRF